MSRPVWVAVYDPEDAAMEPEVIAVATDPGKLDLAVEAWKVDNPHLNFEEVDVLSVSMLDLIE